MRAHKETDTVKPRHSSPATRQFSAIGIRGRCDRGTENARFLDVLRRAPRMFADLRVVQLCRHPYSVLSSGGALLRRTALARRLYALQSWACVVLDEVAPAAGVAAAPLRIEPRALQRAAAAAAAAPDGWCRAVLARALKQAPPALLVRVRGKPYP